MHAGTTGTAATTETGGPVPKTRRAAAAVLVLVATLATSLAVVAASAPASAATDTSWRPAPGAVPATPNVLYLTSSPGESVGAGRTFTYTPANSGYDVAVRNGILTANISAEDQWQAGFTLPVGTATYVTGRTYVDVGPASGEGAGLTVSGRLVGCSSKQIGWYAIDEATTVGGVLMSATIRFEQRCEGRSSAPLRGLLRFDADAPLPPPETPSSPLPALWTPAPRSLPTSGSWYSVVSEDGDPAGNGATSLFTDDRVYVSSAGNELRAMGTASDALGAPSAQLWLSGADRAETLDAGFYSRLLDPRRGNKGRGSFLAQQNLGDCSMDSMSWVAIDEVDQHGGTWNDVTLRFEQRCRNLRPAMRGHLHWETPAAPGAPSVPTSVSATSSGTSAYVSWGAPAAPGTSPVTGYEVFTYVDGTVRGAPRSVGPNARAVVITGLVAGKDHSFKVRAVNAAGASLRSARTSQPAASTLAPVVRSLSPTHGPRTRGTPVMVTGENLAGATDVTVGGQPVEWWPVSDTKIELIAPELAPGTHPVVVTSALGTSAPRTGAVWVADKLVPSAPWGVWGEARAAAIDVRWQIPSSDDPITGFTATATRIDGSSPDRSVRTGPTATSAALTGLVPGGTYAIAVVARSALGTSAAEEAEPVVVPDLELGPFASAPALVGQQYRDFAGRRATAAELTTGAGRLTSGADGPEAAVAAMRNRPEWGGVRAPVIRLYTAYFGRIPDAGGLAYWAGKLRTGTPLARISATFAASSEFTRKQGSLGNAAFVRFVYDAVLGRAPDAEGLGYWARKLAAGTSRGTLMTSFSESAEHKRRTQATVDIVLISTGMLRRVPTAAELTAERAVLADGVPITDLVRRLLDGSEYAGRF